MWLLKVKRVLLVLKEAFVMAILETPWVTKLVTLDVGDKVDMLMSNGLSWLSW